MNDLTETTRTASPNAARDLIYLASCAVNNEIPDKQKCDAMDLDAVFDFARYHILTSIATHAREKVTELPHCFDQAQKKAIRKLSLFDIERIKIYAALEQNGVWYLPLKGITLKSCYPKSSMREMSDNDILCDSGKMDVVKTVMEGLGYSCEVFEEFHHDVYSKPPTLEFEMHHTLFTDDSLPEFSEYFSDISSKLINDSDKGFARHLSSEDFYIYILCHMYKHYCFAGTGLRSLLDIYLYNRKYRDEMDEDYLSRELKKLGLEEFEEKVRNLSEKVYTLRELNGEEQRELEYFEKSGANGTAENLQYNSVSMALGGDDSSNSKRKYILRRVFISGDELKRRHPAVYKHKVLYPLLFIYRPIKAAAHPKRIIDEVKHVKHFKIKEK